MRRFFLIGLLVAALVVLVGTGFLAWIGEEGGLTPVPPVTPGAADIQDIYVFTGIFASAIFLVVSIPLVLFVVRFRRGARDRSLEGPQIRGNTRLELGWTLGAVAIVVAISVFTMLKLGRIETPTAAAGEEGLDVRIEGRRFYWLYEYDNGVLAVNRLRVPVDRVVDVALTAPGGDVIHSWWVPALGGKRDAIPGVVNTMGFRATRTGTFPGRCAEFCGIQHARMNFAAEVMEQEAFERWLEEESGRQEAGESDLGGTVFAEVCAVCHDPDRGVRAAPPLAGNPLLADREAARAIIEQGRGLMPPVGQGWPPRLTDTVLDFLEQLGGGEQGGG